MDNNLSNRLVKCFSLVFPSVETSEIPSASASEMSEWDSLAQVNLLSVIGEEFNLDLDMDDFSEASSFQLILEKLQKLDKA